MSDIIQLLEEFNDYHKPETLDEIINYLEESGQLRISHRTPVFSDGLDTLVNIIVNSDKIKAIFIRDNDLQAYKLVPALSKINSLNLMGTGLGSYSRLFAGLKGNTSITSLFLSKNALGNDGAEALANGLRNNSTITQLDISANQVAYEGVQHLCEALATMPKLDTVMLSGNPLGPNAGGVLGQFLERSASLELLELRNNELGTEGMKQMAQGVSMSKSLRNLDISGNQIAGEGIDAIAVGVSRNTSILCLNISRNDINDNLEGIATLLRENTSLTYLDMNWSGISKNGATILSNALPFNQVLSTVDLSKNRLRNDDMKVLSETILYTSITTFNMLDNEVDNAIAKNYVSRVLSINAVSRKFHLGQQMKVYCHRELLPADMADEKHMLDFLTEYQQTQIERKEVKLVLLGNAGIGKTTLLHNFPTVQKGFWEQLKDIFKKGVKKHNVTPTQGLDEQKIELKNGGKIIVWDVSGNEENIKWLPGVIPNKMVVCLVCYDLSADEETQKSQIQKWIGLLGPNFGDPTPGIRKVILVGMRADSKSMKTSSIDVSQFKDESRTPPESRECIPFCPVLHDKTFEVSRNDAKGIKKLWNEVVKESEALMEANPHIPAPYVALLKALQMENSCVIRDTKFRHYEFGNEKIETGLEFLGSMKELWWTHNMVCTKPVLLAKKLATKSITLDDLLTINDLNEGTSTNH